MTPFRWDAVLPRLADVRWLAQLSGSPVYLRGSLVTPVEDHTRNTGIGHHAVSERAREIRFGLIRMDKE